MITARPPAAALSMPVVTTPLTSTTPYAMTSRPAIADSELIKPQQRVPHSLLARAARWAVSSASVALVCATMFLSGCDYIEKLFGKKSKGTIEGVVPKPDAGKTYSLPRLLKGEGRTKWLAKKAMRRQGELILRGPGTRFQVDCHKVKVHIEYAPGSPRCKRIKRRLYRCEALWSSIYCTRIVRQGRTRTKMYFRMTNSHYP